MADFTVSSDIDSLLQSASVAAARTVLQLGSASLLNAGTGASNLVQLDGTGKLPAVDGSALLNLSSGDLLSTNNLSDLTDAPTARTNLGLGTTDTPTLAGWTVSGVGWGTFARLKGQADNIFIWDTAGTAYIGLASKVEIRWTSGSAGAVTDTALVRDGSAGTLGQRSNGTAQTFRLYSDLGNPAGDYERLSIRMDTSGNATLATEAGGTGSAGNITFSGANRAAFVADATDLPSVITLVNALKATCISHGLMAAS